MLSEICRNSKNEPCVNVIPETEEETALLKEMRSKFRGEDGNHALIMGALDNQQTGEFSASFVVMQRGFPQTFGR